MPLDDSESAGVMPQTVRGRHGSCPCALATPPPRGAPPPGCGFVGGGLPPPPKQPRPAPAADDQTPASLDDDHLHAACVARRRDESEPAKQLELAVDRHIPHAGRLDPLANGVVVLAARVV